MIRFSCEHCGHRMGVQETHAGKRGKCPACRSIITVPAESTLIEFDCGNCGRRLAVPKIQSGKKVVCPKCESVIVVPTGGETAAVNISVVRFTCSACNRQIDEPGSSRGKLVECPHCYNYVPVPSAESPAQEATIPQPTLDDRSEEHFEQMQKDQGKIAPQEPEPVAERKLPWPLDILLYPVTTSGMIHLAILSLLPPMLLPLGHLNYWVRPPIFGLGFSVIFVGYLLYCLSTCVRDGATGSRRAENIDVSLSVLLDVWELISPILLVFVCIAVCLGPLLVYFAVVKRMNFIFWLFAAYGAFSLPMALLATVLFDSLRALNPVLLVTSMLNVFLPYCGLTFLLSTIGGLIGAIIAALPRTQPTAFILSAVCIYLAMIAAHLLGRFYSRYQEKLNWDV